MSISITPVLLKNLLIPHADLLNQAQVQYIVNVLGDAGNKTVRGLTLDSRRIHPEAVFFGLTGGHYKADHFVESARQKLACAAIVDGDVLSVNFVRDFPVITIPRLREIMGEWVSFVLGNPTRDLCVVGVTGTNGKTSCVNILAQLFESAGIRSGTLGTVGFGLWGEGVEKIGFSTPDVLHCHKYLADLKQRGAKHVAMEVSSHGIHQERINGVQFDGAVLTNISHDHLDYHGSFSAYVHEKKRLFLERKLKFAVLNWDDPAGRALYSELIQCSRRDDQLGDKAKIIAFSLTDTSADLHVSHIEYLPSGVNFTVHVKSACYEFSSPLLGDFNLSNVLACLGVALAKSIDLATLAETLRCLQAPVGRMQRIENNIGDDLTVFVDFAHTPDGLSKAMMALKQHQFDNIVLVFGCGGDRDNDKRFVMGGVAAKHASSIYITSDNPRSESPKEIIDQIHQGVGVTQAVTCEVDRAKAIESAILDAEKGSCILIAGKGHEDYQIIGDQVLPFSDFEVARHALSLRNAEVKS